MHYLKNTAEEVEAFREGTHILPFGGERTLISAIFQGGTQILPNANDRNSSNKSIEHI